MPLKFDREKTKQKIALILDKVTREADPQLLSEYRSLFKKEIPFFRRSWAAAYLLMLCDQGQGVGRSSPRTGDRNAGDRNAGDRNAGDRNAGDRATSRPRPEGPRPEGPRPEGPRVILAEEESRRLFISIGRNRHLFPREILGLIITKAQVSREDIGSIRILDSYSFVQVRDSVADTIIEALNGSMFRGRTLSVNYARSRDTAQDYGAADAADTTDTSDAAEESIDEEEGQEQEQDDLEQADDQGDEEGV